MIQMLSSDFPFAPSSLFAAASRAWKTVKLPLSSVVAVVDAVNEVCRVGWQANQVALVLLHDVLQLVLHAWDVVDVRDLLVRP